jgi:membrane protein
MHITTDADLHSSKPPRAPAALVRWVWQLAKDVWTEYRTDRVGDLAAAITFWTILSIPAAVLALVSMLSSLDAIVGQSVRENVESELEDFITTTFSDSEALNSTVTELFGTSSAGIATVATLVALFTLSRAFAGLIRALDVAYEIDESRPWWLLRFTAILLGLGTLVNVVAGATLLAVLPVDGILRVFVAPAVFIALVAWAATVYVRAAGQANDVQTTVGAILLALSLMHLLSIVLLIGAELNDVLARRAGVVMSARSVGERARSLREQLEQRNGTPTRID